MNAADANLVTYDEEPDRYVLANPTDRDEIDRNIDELRTWLANHTPREGWSKGQWQAYRDRLTALEGWLAKSQLVGGRP